MRPQFEWSQGGHEITLSAPLVERLRLLSSREGVHLSITLLAAWQMLLGRLTGQDEITVAVPRPSSPAHGGATTGDPDETLEASANTAGDPTLLELLSRVRDTLGANLLLPAQSPFTIIVPAKTIQHLSAFRLPSWDALDPGWRESIHFRVVEKAHEVVCQLMSVGGPLAGEGIGVVLGQFGHLLSQIATMPEERFRSYSLVTPASRALLPDPTADLPGSPVESLAEMFLHWVTSTPDATAVRKGTRAWSYQELGERALALATALHLHGVEPGDVVALVGSRSFGLIVGILGIMLSGGVLLTIERRFPPKRQRLMLTEARAQWLLLVGTLRSDEEWLREFGFQGIVHVGAEDGLPRAPSQGTMVPSLPTMKPDDPAYIFFTSGTTGLPKAVLGCHKGVSHFVAWQRSTFDIGPEDRVGQLTGVSFDVFLRDVFLPLVSGAALHLPERDDLASELVLAWLDRDGISLLHAVPSLARFWVAHRPPDVSLKTLRWLFFAGEPLTDSLVRLWQEAFPHSGEIVNLYGPTETTLAKCCYRVPMHPLPGIQPIGWPLPDTQVLVLGGNGQLCGIGEPGEIVVRTPFRTLGYLNAPSENDERFISNPFRNVDGDLIYRTGDRGRYRVDGSLEILGRADDQVKIRGVRIELKEIEAVLSRCPGVAANVVVARDEHPGQKYLAAYFVPKTPTPTINELREFLKSELPEAMVPTALIELEELPLTPNGKVDRSALPVPDWGSAETSRSYVPPGSRVEEIITEIWQTVLGRERVGARDNFFDLGGHSLLAVSVVSRLAQTFGIELPVPILFEAPTVVELAPRVEAALAIGQAPTSLPLIREERGQTLPLSLGQKRLWFLDQLWPGDPFYNLPVAVRWKGTLDAEILASSLREVARRHEILRTSFRTEGSEPVQVIAPTFEPRLSIVDFANQAEVDREQEARRLAETEVRKPFDLAEGPLFRVLLLRLRHADHILLVTFHHIVADGWSIGIFLRELLAGYCAHAEGHSASLPELRIQYADFSIWQQRWFRLGKWADQLGYWKNQLAGAPETLELPTDRTRPSVQTFRGANQEVKLPARIATALRGLSRSENATLFMTLLAAFQTLLARYTGQQDICVGTPIAGRNRPDIEELIGFFVNTLVMRARIDTVNTFRELLAQVRKTAIEAYDHQDLPFDHLVDTLQPERDLSRSPLVQVFFDFQNVPPVPLNVPGCVLSEWAIDPGTAKADLALSMAEADGGLKATAVFNTDLFEPDTIARMLGHFRTLLECIVANPNQRLTDLPLLTGHERHHLLVELNQTQRACARGQLVHQLVEAQAERTPEAAAVVFEDQELTYRELNRRANRLAHRLRSLDVGPETAVCICLERSPEMVVAMLAVFKAGGAYVPLDPLYPKERLAFIVADCRPSVVLTQESCAFAFSGLGPQVICLEGHGNGDTAVPELNPHSATGSENIAYIIYTSGSTGRPNGVLVPHRGLLNLVRWHLRAFGVRGTDRATLIAGVAYDASVWELWPYLCSGASVHIPDEETRTTPERLRDWLIARKITISVVPTPLAEQILPLHWPPRSALRVLLTGGDRLHVHPDPSIPFHLVNNYGPTEASVVTTSGIVPVKPSRNGLPSIGRPIDNVQVYILDDYRQPVPIGVSGELYIGGDGVALGYLNRPELTAERFVANPLDGLPGARLFKTGDRVRYLRSGEIEFLNRLDQQVKIRGFRVELGEIEAALCEHPQVRENAVLLQETDRAEKHLAAYVAVKPGATVSRKELGSFLKKKLPEYMIPSRFLLLDALPLTTNGKIDRKALASVAEPSLAEDGELAAARTPLEEKLSEMWAELLDRDRIGIHDDFFALGGHSLLATQVLAQVRDVFNVALSLRTFFERPTVAGLADAIHAMRADQRMPLIQPPVSVARDRLLPLSFAQQAIWFIDQLVPGSPAYSIHVAFRLSGGLNREVLERSLHEMVARHESLRTTFSVVDGHPTLKVHQHAASILNVIDLMETPLPEREGLAKRLIEQETNRSIDLDRGPMVRAMLLRLTDEDHALALTFHHAVADGWSLGIFCQELTVLYDAFATARKSPLLELPLQFADYSVWEQRWLQGEVLERLLDYWKTQLIGAPAKLELPADHPRPAVQTMRGKRYAFELPASLLAAAKDLARKEKSTLFITLLAGFKSFLYGYTDQNDIVVGCPFANRAHKGVEGIVGPLVNTLPLRTQVPIDVSFRELVRRVRQVVLEASDHQWLPFGKLVEALCPPRDPSRNPLFQVNFRVVTGPPAEPRFADMTVEAWHVENGHCKFDLALELIAQQNTFQGYFEYSTDLFERQTIAQMVGDLQNVLYGALSCPDTRVGDLDVLRNLRARVSSPKDTKREPAQTKRVAEVRRRGLDLS
jgi:amino acid adenylation domain-containing protein